MGLRNLLGRLLGKKHRDIRSFDTDVEAVGGVHGRVDRGFKEIPLDKVIGSVGRSHNLRSDFFYKSGEVTGRFKRVGEAMEQGKSLPPLEVYKVKGKDAEGNPAQSAYYVVDGHHRVAIGKQMGMDALDAHVIEYRVDGRVSPDAAPPAEPPAGRDEASK